jgi:hypothetical protein
MNYPLITFSEFNPRRAARGAEAARFDIVEANGEEYWLWMARSDIRKNMMQFPHCKDELQKGLDAYR